MVRAPARSGSYDMKIRIHKDYVKQELTSPTVLIGGVSLSILYLVISTLIINVKLISETLTGNYPVVDKLTLILTLITGITTLYSPIELIIISLMGFLMGINIVLLIKSLHERKKTGDWSFGLGMLGTVATTGCASCGITLLSFLGPSVSLSLLPFQGIFLQMVSMVLLILSLIHTLNRRVKNCIVTTA
jgi:hypothetical protein